MKDNGFGQRLRALRRQKRLTQSEVAEICQLSTRTVQRIENGKVEPRAYTVKLIAGKLGMDLSDKSERITKGSSEYIKGHKVNDETRFSGSPLKFKNNAMKKFSTWSLLAFSAVLVIFFAVNGSAQFGVEEVTKRHVIVELNEDGTLKKVRTMFKKDMNLDSLVHTKQVLRNYGIELDYRNLEFNAENNLVSIMAEVDCNDGFSGSFGANLDSIFGQPIGFFRDYNSTGESSFCTGHCFE